MGDEIELVNDGEGLAILGEKSAVERFVVSTGLTSRDLGPQLAGVLATGGQAAQASAQISANYGRWVKLTEQSARALHQHPLMKGSTAGTSRAVTTDGAGKIKGILEIATGPGSKLTNPAILAGVGGLMAQIAMQQQMEEITSYLASIDEKVDELLRSQKDAVIADMIGAGLVIEESMSIRDHGSKVNEVTWSKVQGTVATIARTQAYALRQLDGLAEKLEGKSKMGDLAKVAKEAETSVQGWLAVLARCFQLQDAIAILELDRVLAAAPEDLDGHRLGLREARVHRRELIAGSVQQLMARLDAAAGDANSKVLFHPTASPALVQSREHVATAVSHFREHLGLEADRETWQARQWSEAATELRDKVLEAGSGQLESTKRSGGRTLSRAKAVTEKLSGEVADRLPGRSRGDTVPEDE